MLNYTKPRTYVHDNGSVINLNFVKVTNSKLFNYLKNPV